MRRIAELQQRKRFIALMALLEPYRRKASWYSGAACWRSLRRVAARVVNWSRGYQSAADAREPILFYLQAHTHAVGAWGENWLGRPKGLLWKCRPCSEVLVAGGMATVGISPQLEGRDPAATVKVITVVLTVNSSRSPSPSTLTESIYIEWVIVFTVLVLFSLQYDLEEQTNMIFMWFPCACSLRYEIDLSLLLLYGCGNTKLSLKW